MVLTQCEFLQNLGHFHTHKNSCHREHQYKHHFKKWRWTKNVPKKKMDQIAQQIEGRARAGKSGTTITLQGRVVEEKKIRRYLKSKVRVDFQSMQVELEKNFDHEEFPLGAPVSAFTNGM
jgi:hypothetical protein